MTDNEALIPRIKAILAEVRATSAETFQLQRLVVDYTERTVTSNDRERIAELERDLAAAKAELRLAWSDCEDATCEACASCVILAKDQRDFAVANLAQNAAITETLRAELEALRATQRDVVCFDAATTPVVEEEQGPWVVMRLKTEDGAPFFVNDASEPEWARHPNDGNDFGDKNAAELARVKTQAVYGGFWEVITLAEAHRIAGAK